MTVLSVAVLCSAPVPPQNHPTKSLRDFAGTPDRSRDFAGTPPSGRTILAMLAEDGSS